MKAMLDPMIAAARTHRPACALHGAMAGVDSITASSHGGFTMSSSCDVYLNSRRIAFRPCLLRLSHLRSGAIASLQLMFIRSRLHLCYAGLAVCQFRIPICSPTFRREIEEIPQWPYQVHMAPVLPGLARSKQELGVKEMVNLAITLHEHVE